MRVLTYSALSLFVFGSFSLNANRGGIISREEFTDESAGVEAYDWRISISTNKEKYKAGESVILTVGMKRQGSTVGKIVPYGPILDFQFIILDTSGAEVPLKIPYLEILKEAGGSLVGVTVNPGEVFKSKMNLSEFYKLVLPGKYSVQVKRFVSSDSAHRVQNEITHRYHSEEIALEEIASNRIEFEIESEPISGE
jgi:hypothetical protein